MGEKVFANETVSGTSNESMEKAIQNAVDHLSSTGKTVFWFDVKDIRGAMQESQIEWQVVLTAGVET